MGKPRSLEAQMTYLCKRHKTGTATTHNDRSNSLKAMAYEIKAQFKLQKLDNLKVKHVSALVEKWKSEGKSTATIKNRMSHLRWAAEKLNKPNMIPRSNEDVGIDKRKIDYNTDKGWTPSKEFKASLPERASLHVELMRDFGMRFKEAATLQPQDIKENHIHLTRGTKNGTERDVPIRTDEQRDLIDRFKAMVPEKDQSMIPVTKGDDYKIFKNSLQNLYASRGMTKEGIGTPHGLRHQYAQDRYIDLTGWKPPAHYEDKMDRALFKASMSHEMKERDSIARNIISAELGHSREHISANYIGTWHQ